MSATSSGAMEIDPFSVICRGCLAVGGKMKNIYEWGLSDDFYRFTEVPEARTERVSELLCARCEETLEACRRFRQRCRQSHDILEASAKKMAKEKADAECLQGIHVSNIYSDNLLIINICTGDMTSKIHLNCPFDCPYHCLKQKDLMLHLVKQHSMNEKTFLIDVQYYCPYKDCSYHLLSRKKHFTGRKYLNQHLNKVHRSKNIQCKTCRLNFSTESEFLRHQATCNVTYICAVCNTEYKTNERLLVHLKRRHPELHEQYKEQRKLSRSLKRVSETITCDTKKFKSDCFKESHTEYACDSPKRSLATQTLNEANIKNDVALPMWMKTDKSEDMDRNFSTIETQTVFEDMLSVKSQNSEDSLFFSETVSLSDIQTQTFPLEFGLSRKETNSSETQTGDKSPDLSIKETQTCFCLCDSPKINFKLFDSVTSSPLTLSHLNLTSTETQTLDDRCVGKSDVMLSFNSAETQTCFEDNSL
ncbi:hypothetical protein JYU34_008263 [Plutella xylostella]|uniref:ZAD domain-containing protein n=1 Tax=Plutella xylostella TaxID=51655 RepID=A0ABQ7QP42_PLUXY|nr:hypothetical protein JYU34_008263 [Plutella xylostella]